MTLFLTLFAVAAIASTAQEQKIKPTAEQTIFLEGESFQHVVSLPPLALRALVQTKEISEALLESGRDEYRKHPAQLFQPAEVHLGESNEVDMIVEGFPPVSGVDNAWFWIVLSAYGTPKVVLWRGGDSIEVMPRKTNGYKNLRCSWSSASGYTREWTYHFDGEKYVLSKEREFRRPK
jgi:hypothetical protein